MTADQFGNQVVTEAKELIVGQMKRKFEERQILDLLKDDRTIKRERNSLIEKLRAIKTIEYLSEQQLEDILKGTPFTKENLMQDIKDARNTNILDKNAQTKIMKIDQTLFLPTYEKLR